MSGSSDTETRGKMKIMKLPGNEHFSLVDEEDEKKVICDLFPFQKRNITRFREEEMVLKPICSRWMRRGVKLFTPWLDRTYYP